MRCGISILVAVVTAIVSLQEFHAYECYLKCEWPQPMVFQLYELNNSTANNYTNPSSIVVNRCERTGCCKTDYLCSVVEVSDGNVTIRNGTKYENFLYKEHVKCGCHSNSGSPK